MHIYYRLVHRQEKYRMPSQYSLRWNITKIPLSIVVFALVCVLSARDEEGCRLIPEADQTWSEHGDKWVKVRVWSQLEGRYLSSREKGKTRSGQYHNLRMARGRTANGVMKEKMKNRVICSILEGYESLMQYIMQYRIGTVLVFVPSASTLTRRA